MSARLAHRMATVAGWLAVTIGAVHLAFTAQAFDRPSLDALWFAGSGLAVMLIGALTLLARHHAVRVVAVLANGAGLALAIAFGVLTDWRQPHGPILAATFVVGGVACWLAVPAPPPR